MTEKKVILLILDGVGDRPDTNGRTPLSSARTPRMDRLAKRGACGLVDMISPGVPPGSDTSHLTLLGYDPYEVYTGRGPFEAMGLGMKVMPGDIALRCNFATVDDDLMVRDRRAGRISSGTKDLVRSLSGEVIDGITFLLEAGVEHRCALVMRGDSLSPDVSDMDPHAEGEPLPTPRALRPEARRTADALAAFQERARRRLADHPVNTERRARGLPEANAILSRGAGVVPRLPPLQDRYHVRGVCIAGIPLIRGVAELAGMHVADVPGATGSVDTDIEAKFRMLTSLWEGYDLFLVNIKGADVYGHDGDPRGKTEFIERVDEALSPLLEMDGFVLGLTGDHSTPVSVREHSGDPLPLCIFGEGVRHDDVSRFDEFSCARGGLGRLRGRDILPILLDLANRSEKFGA